MARKGSTTTTDATATVTRKRRRQPEPAERPSGPATLLAQSLPAVLPPPPVEEPAAELSDAAEPPDDSVAQDGVVTTGQPSPAGAPQPERQWAPPYRAAFTSVVGGLEVGEDRRFKQVVIRFADRPGPEVTDRLKEAGFKYRPAERSWTAPASAAAREFALGLAQELHLRAGGNTLPGPGR